MDINELNEIFEAIQNPSKKDDLGTKFDTFLSAITGDESKDK